MSSISLLSLRYKGAAFLVYIIKGAFTLMKVCTPYNIVRGFSAAFCVFFVRFILVSSALKPFNGLPHPGLTL